MGCCGDREKGPPERKQKWEFINLQDFRNKSFWTVLAYIWLWCMGGVGVAVYAVDTFTAVQLLVFDRWSSQVKPWIPFNYSKWIFAGCILFSWALLIYEWIRALRVIRRGGVAASYMDPLAASLQSMRSKGWRRFLVFTALTKSKKGTDYVAFFVYFAFQSSIRIILAEGPRQVINGLTLGSIMETKIINKHTDDDTSGIEQFWINLQALANQNIQQAIILGSMLFTMVIWIFSALCLISAGVLYLVFLWHYIPQRDGRLRIYCRRKIDRRLEKIVEAKVQEGIEDEAKKKAKEEKRAELKRQKTGELPPPAPPTLDRKPTLPDMDVDMDIKDEAKLPEFGLQRQPTNTTVSTLPLYSSRPPTRQGLERQPTLPDLAGDLPRPSMGSRSVTQSSAWTDVSYESDAPLLSNAGCAGGDGRSASPAPTYFSRQNSNGSFRPPPPGRTMTGSTQASSQRSFTPMSASSRGVNGPLLRSNSSFSYDHEPNSASPITPVDSYGRPLPPVRQNTGEAFRSGPRRQGSSDSSFSRSVAGTPGPTIDRRPTPGSLHSQNSFSRPMPRNPSQTSQFQRPFSPITEVSSQPTPPPDSYEMTSKPSTGGYVAFTPGVRSASTAPVPAGQRNFSAAQPGAGGSYFGTVQEPQRSATVPNGMRAVSSYGDILDDYAETPPPNGPQRSHTAGPGGGGWGGSHF
jgi:hypothetical protein